MGRNKGGSAIPDIRVKEEFKPRDKNIQPKEKGRQPKVKNCAMGKEAKRLMLRQIASVSKNDEEADPSMQEVDHAADVTAARFHSAAERGRDAFQRQARKRAEDRTEKEQIKDRFSHASSNPSYQSDQHGYSRTATHDEARFRQREKQELSDRASPREIQTKRDPVLRAAPNCSEAPKTKQPATIKTAASSAQAQIKTTPTTFHAAGSVQPKTRTLPQRAIGARSAATERGRRKFRQDAQRKLAAQAKQAAKRTVELTKKAAAAVSKAVSALIGALAGGGIVAVLVVVFLLVAIIAAIVSSPFGVFFSGSGPDTVPLSTAIAEINAEYCSVLMELQDGDYDEISLTGSPPDWTDVVAVFACFTASDTPDATDVATLDRSRIERLENVFWDMCEISAEEQAVEHPDPTPEDDTDDSYTTTTLFITITGRTAEEMRTELDFDEYQNKALDELLAERESLRSLLGDLTISDELAAEIWHSLPPDLSTERKQVIRYALSLVGKVNYFWGGKSRVLGWDSRWGQLQKVWAEGSETTGTYRPYGLDCSGFVDWVFYNASSGEIILGQGGGVTSQHINCAAITWEEAQPGDLVFYADNSHIGIVAGKDENGNLRIIHCNASANNVSISGSNGFSSVGKPNVF